MKTVISQFISDKNSNKEKILSVFLTAGFPNKDRFVDIALNILDAGADMLEIGFPFSDPIADGSVIQQSSKAVLGKGINLEQTFEYVEEIRRHSHKPLILMGYANPLLRFGLERFAETARQTGVNGLIVPDIPLDEYDDFFNSKLNGVDIILLITPTTPADRIIEIDKKSSGFIYCVSHTGITGTNQSTVDDNIQFISKAYQQCKNKFLIGFGISSPEDVQLYKPYCDGVIVGSAVIKSLMNDDNKYKNTIDLVRNLKTGLIS